MNGMQSRQSSRKLIGGLVLIIGIGAVIAAVVSGTNPFAFLPFLLILACPLMMIFMMGSMGHNHGSGADTQRGSWTDGVPDDLPDLAGLPRDQQVWALRRELTRLAWRQAALRQDLERLQDEPKAEGVGEAAERALPGR